MYQSFDPPAGAGDSAARLSRLREALADAGFDGMLVPRGDAHMNEMVAPSEERLAWLTGFTGSAGLAIVLANRAALLVDGRYTLQAGQQTDAAAFEVVPSQEVSAGEWLTQAAPEGAVIGYDPWLHGREEIARLARALESVKAVLRPLKANPVDRLWTDRPAPPAGAVRLHPDALAGDTAADKRIRLGKALGEAGTRSAVLTRPDSIAWLLNIRGADLSHVPVALGFAILHEDGRVALFMAPDKIDGTVRAALGEAVSVTPPERFGEAVDALAPGPVRLDERTCPVWIAERLEAAGAAIDWDRDPCVLPKARKTAAELAGIRAAHRRDGVAMVRFLHWLETRAEAGETPGEIEIAETLEGFRRDTGYLSDISFDTISGAGPHGAIVHYRVNRETERALAPGEVLLIDSGAQYPDGTTDITRTLAFGPVDPQVPRPFTLVLRGMIAIATARWPAGLTGRDLDPLARAALWRAGFDYDHGTGHGVGAYLDVHEGPVGLSRRSGTVALEPGMVLSDEPGYYREGAFGIRIENLLAVTEAAVPEGGDRPMLGFETLTLCPVDRRLILPELLAPEERAWLDAYHARVLDVLGPEVPAEARSWLERACAPLGPAGAMDAPGPLG